MLLHCLLPAALIASTLTKGVNIHFTAFPFDTPFPTTDEQFHMHSAFLVASHTW